jgi:hypothetical protein
MPTGMVGNPLAEKLIQPPSFLKCLAANDLTTESTEEELRRLLFLVFSVFSVVNAIDDAC